MASTLNTQPFTLNTQPFTLNTQHSTLNTQVEVATPDPLEGFCYSNVANLTRVGGIYLQVYNRQEAWAVDDP